MVVKQIEMVKSFLSDWTFDFPITLPPITMELENRGLEDDWLVSKGGHFPLPWLWEEGYWDRVSVVYGIGNTMGHRKVRSKNVGTQNLSRSLVWGEFFPLIKVK